jgi:hypothetical protein
VRIAGRNEDGMSEQENKKTMKHTRGPWRFSTEPQPNGCPIVGNARGLMVAVLAHSINYNSQREEALANARLIAAAPELLDALEAFLRAPACGSSGPCSVNITVQDYNLKAARAAIAKATGAQ